MRSEKEADTTGNVNKSQKLNSLFSKITGKNRTSSFGKFSQTPLMDLIERKEELVVKVDLPGVSKKDIILEIQDHYLTITAECPYDDEAGHYIRRERFYQRYEGAINLPVDIDEEKACAKLSNGVLTVILPKKGLEKNAIEID